MYKSFKIITFGCKTNQHESDIIEKELVSKGFKLKYKNENTDYTIINSCTVTANADSEALYTLRKIKRDEPDTKIIFTGCLAQVDAENLKNNPDIFLLLGNNEKLNIYNYIEQNEKAFVSELPKTFNVKNLITTHKTRATIKIQDGCNNYCSYCIVPFARGESRSNSLENIVSNIKELAKSGYKEIVLSAIHLGLWGLDFSPKLKLVNLLEELENIDYPIRYRLGSLNPQELDNETMDFLIKSKKICNHLHISLQSANNRILKEMNRHNSVEEAKEKLDYLNRNIKELNIGADVIVGFPTETDEEFEDTCQNIESMPISYLHIFPYSIRKGTKAALMKPQIDEQIKKERLQILKTQITKKREKFLNSLIGTTQHVLIERNKNENFAKGITSNYIKVNLLESDKINNEIVEVKIKGNNGGTLIGS